MGLEYASIKYSVSCPNSNDCNNTGQYTVIIGEFPIYDIPNDDLPDGQSHQLGFHYVIVDVEHQYETVSCLLCEVNPSSIFNGGTIGEFVLLSEHISFQNSLINVNFDGVNMPNYINTKQMQNKRVAVFTYVIDRYIPSFEGRCFGEYIYNKKGIREKINLNTNLYFLAR